jgi:Tol biopolymer transport system component
LSPDDEWLAFSSFREQEDIFVSRTDGSGLHQLTNDAPNDRFPRWSPDGKRIAFYSARSGSYQVWVVDPDGSGLQQITEYTGGTVVYPVWSPDGSRIAATDNSNNRVFIFEPAKPWKEQTPQLLPPPPGGESFAARSWSPDGRWLAGQDIHPGHPRGGILIYSLESQTYQRLTDFGAGPEWLSDSRRLLFNFQGKLFLVDSQSKKSREVLSVPGESLFEASLSRDNRQIYFTRRTNEADIWMATLK